MENNAKKSNWIKSGDIAAIIHVFYADLIEEIAEKTHNLPQNTDYYISIPNDHPDVVDAVREHFPNAQILIVENRGRDILPFLEVLNGILPLNYDLLVKIHSKKTPHRADGTSWRQDIYEKLLGSADLINVIIQSFKTNPEQGMLGPKGQVVNARYYMFENKTIFLELAKRIGLVANEQFDFPFVSSTMFWARPELFKKLIGADFLKAEFPNEPIKSDGTIVHGLERIFGLATIHAGLEINTVDLDGHIEKPNPNEISPFAYKPRALLLSDIKSLVYYGTKHVGYAVEHIRITAPYQQAGIELIDGFVDGQADIERIQLGDAVIFHRSFPGSIENFEKFIWKARELEKPVIFEIDDLLFNLPEDHPEQKLDLYKSHLMPILFALNEADLVVTSTPKIKELLSGFNPNILVLPNYLDDHLWTLRSIAVNENVPLTIMYMGTDSHTPDLEGIAPALLHLLDKYQGKLMVRVIGTPLPQSLTARPDVTFEPAPNNIYTAFVEYFLNQTTDIFIAPLNHNLFNQCKSHLKFLEYSALGVPGVYADLDPYHEIVEHGEDGFLASSVKEWIVHLEKLIESPELRRKVAEAAQYKLRNYYLLSSQIKNWQDIVGELIPEKFTDVYNLSDKMALTTSVLRKIQSSHRESTDKIFYQEKELASLSTHLTRLQTQLTDTQKHYQRTQNQLKNTQAQLGDSQTLNHHLQNSLEDAQMVIVDYATSTSWKLTRPLRKFSKWIKKR